MGNWIDAGVVAFLVIFVLGALGRPFVLEFLDLLSFLLASFFSFTFYNLPAKFLEIQFRVPHGLSLVVGFMVIWFISETLFYLVVRMLISKEGILRFKSFDFLSVLPAFFRGLIFVAFLLVMFATFPIQPSIKKGVLDSQIGSRILQNAYRLEQPLKQVFGSFTNDSLTFLTIKPETDEKVSLGFQTTNVNVDTQAEDTMFNLVNQARASRGISILVLDSKLQDIARSHAKDMFEQGYFAHFSPEGKTVADRAENAGIDFLVVGENLAYAPDVDLAHKGLMNSEGHRANILSTDFSKAGIGVINGGIYGKMFVQVFTN
ncbi:hypothetical protein HYW43_03540 [Candidatus Daviesbacteria bacterium]|nr:hypothetical protein [Candidatus Daviesbacteria bacterium]